MVANSLNLPGTAAELQFAEQIIVGCHFNPIPRERRVLLAAADAIQRC